MRSLTPRGWLRLAAGEWAGSFWQNHELFSTLLSDRGEASAAAATLLAFAARASMLRLVVLWRSLVKGVTGLPLVLLVLWRRLDSSDLLAPSGFSGVVCRFLMFSNEALQIPTRNVSAGRHSCRGTKD